MALRSTYLHTVVKCTENTPSRYTVQEGEDRSVPLTIATLAPAFLEWAGYEMRRAPNTIQRYKEALGWIVRTIGDLPVAELHLGHVMLVRRALIDRGCGEARVASILNAFRSFLKFCHEVLRMQVLDYREVRVPRIPKREVVYLTKEEVGRFVQAIMAPDEDPDGVALTRLRFRALVEVLLATGARISEVTGLDRADLNMERHEAKIVGKGGRERVLYFTERSLFWLRCYLARRVDDEPALFVTQGDPPQRLDREDIKRAFATYRAKAGLAKRVSAHILRHTVATTLLFNGCPIGHIKEILGHERLDTTCRYYLGIDKRAAKAAHQQFTTYDD